MKTPRPYSISCLCLFKVSLLCLAFFLFAESAAHAGLTFELHIARFGQGQSYKFFTPLNTDSTTPAAPFGTYLISSPFFSAAQTTNGSWRAIEVGAGGVNTVGGIENPYPDFNSLMNQMTNGPWTIVFTNNTTTNVFNFTISASTFTSNMLPSVIITYPGNSALDIPNQPTLKWQTAPPWPSPTFNTYVANYDNSFYEGVVFPPGQTNWTPDPIPNGLNCNFNVGYLTNFPASFFVITTPLNTNASHAVISGWSPTNTVESDDSVSFSITNPQVATPRLVAHYAFDNENNIGEDSSGNGYDLDFDGGNGIISTNDSKSGNAAYFDGGSFLSYNSAPTNVMHALAGDFSLSFWIKTSQDSGNDNGPAWNGAGIVAADVGGLRKDLVPAALDGGQIGFNTGGDFDDTVNTTADINQDGHYHHIVVTRVEATGEKRVYVDGMLDNSDFSSQYPLSDPKTLAVGCAIDASEADPNSFGPRQYFQGTLDDLQIYAGALSDGQVASLFHSPGTTINGPGGSGLVAHYSFDDSNNVGRDNSGNGNDLDFNGGNGVSTSNDVQAGGAAADFDGGSFLSYNSTPSAVLNAFAGSFSVSFWIKTTQDDGNEDGSAYAGAGIVAADVGGLANDLVPAALDGGQIGFNTGGDSDDTLNSMADVNQGSPFHHVVVTRDQATGEKRIYIDGVLNNSQVATKNLLNDPMLVAVGCSIDAFYSDPNDANPQQYFEGLLDDLQIYSRVLSPADVGFLFSHPGSTASAVSGGGHQNVAHYTFDDSLNLGHDSSGNGNDMPGRTTWGPDEQPSSDAIAGGGAVRFFGGSGLTANEQTTSNLDAVLAGSFTFSAWIKTAATIGEDDGDAFYGGVIFWADNSPNTTNDTIPLSVTGSKLAFSTRGSDHVLDTLHSTTSVNDGTYHLLMVTRNQTTGEKKVYVDGNFEGSQISTTDPLNANNHFLSIGGFAYYVDDTLTNFSSFKGLVDDLQIYSGVLSTSDAAYLYSHPGATVADVAGGDLNVALNTTGQVWSTGGDGSWFIENSVTHDGVSAAQSGAIGDGQTNYLETTALINGQVSFYWKVSSEFNYDFLHFYINGIETNSISGEVDWNQQTYLVTTGDVLRWDYTKDSCCDSNGLDAGFLDEVSFIVIPLRITTNPFNQTNYPGYNVALLAAASGNPTPTFQWYKVGLGLISGATNSLYIPTNSGNASVAGNYYAIASNAQGSAITTTAAVSFVSAPLPPDWSIAFKSMFEPVDETQTNFDYYYGCTVDTNGNIYTAAKFSGIMTVGSQKLFSGPGGNAAAVVKQSPTGLPLWAAAITNNGSGHSYALNIAPALGGGVYVSGNYSGTNWLGTNQLTDTGSGNMFIARLDANGSNIWVKTFGGGKSDFTLINSLTSDSSGVVTICGLLGAGSVTIGSSNYTVVDQEGVIFQLDQTGAVLWSQILSGEFPEYLTSGGGRIYVSVNSVANVGSTNVIGSTNVVIGGTSNLTDRAWALACLNSANGNAIWVRGVGERSGSGNDNPYATGVQDDVPRIAVSGTNVFITGVAYDYTAVFGSITVNFNLPRGQYFARYDTNGNSQLATTYGSISTTPLVAVANTNGDVYVCGDFDTYSYFGRDLLAAPFYPKLNLGGFSDAFVAKFDLNGNPLWARRVTSPAAVNFHGLALATDGVWASGWGVTSNLTAFSPIFFGTNAVRSEVRQLVSGPGGSVFNLFYPAGVLGKITESTIPGTPLLITLGTPRNTGTNFQFSFPSQSGFTHSVQYRTNLVIGQDWQTYSNVIGDGNLQSIPIPYSVFSPAKQGFIRLKTQ